MVSRRSFLLGASSIAIGAANCVAAERGQSQGRLAVGITSPNYYIAFCPFLDWWKQAGSYELHRRMEGNLAGQAIWEAGRYFDPVSGELVNPVPSDVTGISRIFFANLNPFMYALGCNYSGEAFIAKWDGSASGNIDFLTPGGRQDKSVAGQISFRMGTNPGNTQLTLTVTNPNDPPRNIRIYQARYASDMAAGELFNPDWLAEVKKFGVIRFMDWQSTNNSTIRDFSQLADTDYAALCTAFSSHGTNGTFGPKGSVHPNLICQLASQTGCKVHVCIPLHASDAFVTSFATYMRDHTDVEVTYELSNECWNFGFAQTGDTFNLGSAIWPGDGGRGFKYYGYRAAACMKIVHDIYRDPARWRGALATQTVNTGVTNANLAGVNYWLKNDLSPANSLKITDLFKSLYVTGYFGDVVRSTCPTAITKANPGVVTSKNHGYSSGQTLMMWIGSGMTQLNKKKVTISRVDTNSYSLDIDTSDFGSYISDDRNYVTRSTIFDLIDESLAKFANDPVAYRTKYTYFNQQVAQSFLSGTCSFGYSTSVSVASMQATFWPAQLAIAKANGLTLRQYEGGCHFVGDVYLTGYGSNARLTEYLLNSSRSKELAAVYAAMYSAFRSIGGEFPAKFVLDGPISQYGSWGGITYWPTIANGNTSDVANPVWQAVLNANGV